MVIAIIMEPNVKLRNAIFRELSNEYGLDMSVRQVFED